MKRKHEPREPENRTSPPRRKLSGGTVVKYIVLSIGGVLLYLVAHDYATADRGYIAFGGEMFFVLLPVLYWLIATTVKDWKTTISEVFKRGDMD